MWDEIGVGTLDDDIKIAKLQLRRALLAQAKPEVGDDQGWRDQRVVQQAVAACSVGRDTFRESSNCVAICGKGERHEQWLLEPGLQR
ncbi:hypothetical protein [Pseudomonas chlororaphis]|uniref:hypothetical protein n=1 Tax=Pseudomonas chlororaphis TaxID=587753 RepID=UPI002D7844EB|nr:hypothetical protein [Pseudomonas chlororaphis]